MRRLALLVPALLLVGASSESRDFGAGVTLTETTPLADILAAPERYTADPVVVAGRITDVCQKKGCWTVLTEGKNTVRVRFQDYGFFLPKDAFGATALVQGVVVVRVLSEKEARHYAAESRQGDAIQGEQREVGFVASGVRLAR
jgi:hypothetical protein